MAFTMEEEPQVPFDAPPCGGLLRPGSSTARRGGAHFSLEEFVVALRSG